MNSSLSPKINHNKTVLIFGISSFVGSNLANYLKRFFKVAGTYYTTPINIPGVMCVPCDVLQKEGVKLTLYTVQPDVTIYCVGMNTVVECSNRVEMSDALNTSGLFNVTEVCQRYKSQICYISTDFVFSGENKNYTEMDIPDPSTILGKTKSSGEFFIQKNSLNYMIYRVCNLYGYHINPKKRSHFERLQRATSSTTLQAYDCYVKQGFIDVLYLSQIVKMCIERGMQNRVLQVCSKDIMTYHEFAMIYCKIFQDSMSRIAKGRWSFPLAQLRDNLEENWYYQLSSFNLESLLNIDLPTIEESLMFTFKRLNGKIMLKQEKKSGGSISFI